MRPFDRSAVVAAALGPQSTERHIATNSLAANRGGAGRRVTNTCKAEEKKKCLFWYTLKVTEHEELVSMGAVAPLKCWPIKKDAW